MKKMSPLVATAISTAIFCGIWTVAANVFGLLGWAGFAGCTTYFSTGKHGKAGLLKTVCTNTAGVLCGVLSFLLAALIPAFNEWGVWCTIVTFVMVVLSGLKLFDFCPGIFMGCFCTFAAGGNWQQLLIAMLLGAVLGVLCDSGGVWLHQVCNKEK